MAAVTIEAEIRAIDAVGLAWPEIKVASRLLVRGQAAPRPFVGLDAALGGIDRTKLNVNGSSLAAGHPFAATGGRIVAQLAKQLAQQRAETGRPVRGLISICAAGGQGVTAILEA